MKTISYIFRKIKIFLFSYFARKYKIENNIFYFSNRINKNKRALFYFPDSLLMHVGDHLFFEPICRLFRENGYHVIIAPTKPLYSYFTNLEYTLLDQLVIEEEYELVISSSRFIDKLRKLDSQILLIETECPEIKKALIDDVCEKLIKFFEFKKNIDFKPSTPNISGIEFEFIDKSKSYVIFSNYLVSGSFRVFNNKFNKLIAYAQEFKLAHPNTIFIHVGTQNDKDFDTKEYDFIDIDLRGKTSLLEIFALVNEPLVTTYIGFDNFLMHIFFINDKDVKILSRGRWSKKSRYFLHNFIDPPFNQNLYKGKKEYILP